MSGKTRKTVDTIWEISTYDVWGNADDGFEVNDVYRHGETEIACKVEVNNRGTPQEFLSAYPTDYQIKKVFGTRSRIDTEGDDLVIYVNRARDCYPIGELRCISHKSLSPIQSI